MITLIDFEKIQRDTLNFLNANLPPEGQRDGTQRLTASINSGIALGCAKALKEYHSALQAPKIPPLDEH